MKSVQPLLKWQAEMTAIRRELHAHPELAYEERGTADLVAERLQSWGIPVHRGLGLTGVVGTIQGRHPGPAIGLRADMDALPMQEANGFAHASRQPGKMHACGHDGHTTMLLYAARHLAENPDFSGTVHLIFQPAEEGHAGARKMIEDGLFERFPMEAVFGMHNWPGMPTGTFGLVPGPMMASSSTFAIDIQGQGTHAAMPHLGSDPLMAAAQLVQGLQTIVSRNCDPLEPAVLSVTQLHAGSADNVIADRAELRGTVRAFSDSTLDLIEDRMRELTRLSCAALGCESTFHFERRYPPTLNHERETALCAEVLAGLVGADKVDRAIQPSMGAEDFSFMLEQRPGCYVWIGNGDGSHRSAGHGPGPCSLHNPSYDFNDDILPLGAAYWVALVQRRLAS